MEINQRQIQAETGIKPGTDLPQLTGVRAIAAWMVYVYHSRTTLFSGDGLGARLAGQSHIGVNIFFVLSGLLIPWRYASSMALEPRWLIGYARNRIARIYPLATLATVLWLGALRTADLKIWVLCLFLLKAFSPSTIYAGVPQAWTLTVEECFYFLAPFIVVWGRGKSKIKWLLCLTIAFWAAGFCTYGPGRFFVQFTIFGRYFEFLAGMMLADLLARPAAARVRRFPLLTLLGLAGVLVGMLLLDACERIHAITMWYAIDNFLLPLSIAVGFYGLIVEHSPIRWLLATPPLVFCGKASYAFYLFHVSDLETRLGLAGFNIAERFVLLMVIAGLLHVGFEEPFRRRIRGSNRTASITSRSADTAPPPG